MPSLVAPRSSLAGSVRRAARSGEWDDHPTYAGVAGMDDAEFDAWTDRFVADAREGTPRPEGFVPSTNLWWVDGAEFLGRVQVRHRLTPRLRDLGGHVGYWVAPAARRRGHATAMLAAVLPVANALGLECVLVTCDVDNVGSRRVIEANGGLFEGRRGEKLRFWVPTA
ncbi:GNAT family N-acetyltransferase [Kineococcus endophyticus]|uniref:GNAT family N-acetyltransferase n=1 Tax=Kineococcus endophyticus TaxID=1181883 RepID=A0ABV3P459_9ACTN